MDKNELYIEAIRLWGIIPQFDQLVEECAETIVAMNHLKRGKPDAEDELLGELADLEIMIEQMKFIFGEERIETKKYDKLKRLQKIVEEEISVQKQEAGKPTI